MGQYHAIYNVTKQEVFSGWGAKLWEKASSPAECMGLMVLLSNSNGRGGGDLYVSPESYSDVKPFKPNFTAEQAKLQRAIDKISGRWAGDQIVIQGDYAKAGDSSFIESKDAYKDITPLVEAAIRHEFPEFFKKQDDFKAYIKKNFKLKTKSQKLKAII